MSGANRHDPLWKPVAHFNRVTGLRSRRWANKSKRGKVRATCPGLVITMRFEAGPQLQTVCSANAPSLQGPSEGGGNSWHG